MADLHLTYGEDERGPVTYRAYRLGPDGQIVSAEIVRAASDDEALAIVASMSNRFGIDLWERSRFLASYSPRPPIQA